MELLPLISCFLRENYVQSWAFPAFAAISLWAQKLNQQPTVKYDMGNQEGAIDNKGPQELLKTSVYLFVAKVHSQTQYSRQTSVIVLLHGTL